jgi:hypothetical protein
MVTLEELFAQARDSGIGDEFKALHDVLVKHGLIASPSRGTIYYKVSDDLLKTPYDKYNLLIWIEAKPRVEGRVRVRLDSTRFATYYPIGPLEVRKMIGDDGSYDMDAKRVKLFVQEIDALFAKIKSSE